MNYDYYRIFYYVAKHKNITKAAEELYSSQPAVTRVIQSMEDQLGCRLFIRHKTGVELTREGQVLYDYVALAHSQLTKGEEEVSRAMNTENGIIYIGATVTALHEFLFDYLNKFHERFPGVRYRIATGSSDGTIERLKNGTVDLAFVTTPFSRPRDANIAKIHTFQDILIGGKEYRELSRKKNKLSDVMKKPFVALVKGMQWRDFLDKTFAENGMTLDAEIETDSADMIIPIIRHNLGIGFIPSSMAKNSMQRGEVFRIPLEQELQPRSVFLLTDRTHPQTNASRELYRSVISEYLIE